MGVRRTISNFEIKEPEFRIQNREFKIESLFSPDTFSYAPDAPCTLSFLQRTTDHGQLTICPSFFSPFPCFTPSPPRPAAFCLLFLNSQFAIPNYASSISPLFSLYCKRSTSRYLLIKHIILWLVLRRQDLGRDILCFRYHPGGYLPKWACYQ